MASVEKLPMLAEGYEKLIAELKALNMYKVCGPALEKRQKQMGERAGSD